MRPNKCLVPCLLVLLAASLTWAATPVEVIVQGLEGEELKNVQAALAVPPDLVKQDLGDEAWLEHFLDRIPGKVREALTPFGYYHGTATASRETTPEGAVKVRAAVVKGEPVLVRGVVIRIEGMGKDEEDFRRLTANYPLAPGMTLRHDIYEEAKRGIHDAAIRHGCLDGRFLVHEARVDLGKRTADIEIVYDTGPRYSFGAIRVTGAPLYPRPFLNRYLSFQEGETFSYEKLRETQRNLILADRFADVLIEIDKENARDHRIPVEIKLRPGPERHLKLGVGYGTDTGPRASINYRDKNIFAAGHHWEGGINVSRIFQGLALGYTIPGRDVRTFSVLGVNLKRDNPDTYDTKEFSMELQHVRPYVFDRSGAVFLQMLREDSVAGDTQTNTFSLMPGCRIFDRWFDHPTRPGKGYSYVAEVRGGHQSLGSYTGFLQATITANGIHALGGGFSLLGRIKLGVTVQNEDFRDLPIAIRYFAGGDNSVRGYAYQSLGAKDQRGEVVGGRHTVTGSVEMEKALFKDWAAATFYDWGNAFNSFREADLASGAGLGLRYYTPVGPIKLDLARQIGTAEPTLRLHLSFGFTL
ncbi:MAG: autotransporter assembly complex family protein [Pseudomonadota bacterium]|nr:autotransporter assembly complex family protein [Pseudomonadota bacterium]